MSYDNKQRIRSSTYPNYRVTLVLDIHLIGSCPSHNVILVSMLHLNIRNIALVVVEVFPYEVILVPRIAPF